MRKSIAAAALAAAALAVPGAAYATGAVTHSAPTVRQCTHADVNVSYVGRDGAMSHQYGNLVMFNHSDSACRTGGFGGVSYVGHGNGTQIGAAADRDTTIPVKSFVLQPNQKLVQLVVETSFGVFDNCKPTKVDGFRVYIPNETKSQFIKHPTTGCANPKIHLLSHRAYHRP